MTPRIQIIIPMWNKTLETDCLARRAAESVFQHVKSDYVLTLFNNASPFLGSWARKYPKAILLSSSENLGFGRSINVAAAMTRSEYICQMNSDCDLVEDSVSQLIKFMEMYNVDVGMPEHYENCQHYGIQKSEEIMGKDWRFGAFWVARRKAFESVGGFDTDYDMCYFEDTDLWKRLESQGFLVAGYRGTWVKHLGGASSLPNRDELFAKNKRLFESRWGASST